MGRKSQSSGGIEIRQNSIRLRFTVGGKRFVETLYLGDTPMPPTPPNVKYAARVAIEIRQKITAGVFEITDYFPHSTAAKPADPAKSDLLHDVMDRWIHLYPGRASTKKIYAMRINTFWKKHLENIAIKKIKHSDILEALSKGTWKSGKSRNNELSLIRSMFEFAVKDGLIKENPSKGIERQKHQRPPIDPFSQDEVNLILSSIREHHNEQIWNYQQFVFYTGLRTSEAIGLKWEAVDWQKSEVLVSGGIVYDEESEVTKTAKARKVKLNSLSKEALQRQRAHTSLKSEYVFNDPATGELWVYKKLTDIRTYWQLTLKRCGLRYRRPYNMRHTYATLGLMSGANPGFLAKQLGHSKQMFFAVYADWIDGESDDREMAKIEAAIRHYVPDVYPDSLLLAAGKGKK